MFGSRYETNHPDIKKIQLIPQDMHFVMSRANLLNTFPILQYFPLTINKKIGDDNMLVENDGQIRDCTDALIQAAKDAEEKGDLESQGLTQPTTLSYLSLTSSPGGDSPIKYMGMIFLSLRV